MELTVALHKTRNSNFPEGIKALLIDKSKNPKWNPSRIEDLESSKINKYFKALEGWDCSLKV